MIKRYSLEGFIQRHGKIEGPKKHDQYWIFRKGHIKKLAEKKKLGTNGITRFFRYKKVQSLFDINGLPNWKIQELNTFFNNNTTFKPWHINILIEFVSRDFKNYNLRFQKILLTSQNSKERYILIYGDSDGIKKYNQLVEQAIKNHKNRLEYWLSRGYTEEQAKEKVSEIQAYRSSQSPSTQKGSIEYTSRRSEIWIKKGYTKKQAKEKVKKIQTTNGINYYMHKYGYEIGRTKFEKRILRWKSKLRSTQETNGAWIPLEQLSEKEKYYRLVTKYTEQNYRKYYNQINPNSLL